MTAGPSRVYADRWQAPLLAALTALDGQPCPSNQTLAGLLGISAGQLDFALARAIRAERLRREDRKRSRRLVVLDADGGEAAGTDWSRAGGNVLQHHLREAAVLAALKAGGMVPFQTTSADQRAAVDAAMEARRVVRDRCPCCELPPLHSECRHGWDGLTTMAMRRAIAFEAGLAA